MNKISFAILLAGLVALLEGCGGDVKYDEPPTPANNSASSQPGQPSGTAPGQYGVRSDKADEGR
jgi:hypothetical protein